MKINFTGCALCNSTWGDYHGKIEDTELFFCCDVCYVIYKQIVERIKKEYFLKSIDYLEIDGNPSERTFKAVNNNKTFTGKINFLKGNIIRFQSSEITN